MPITQDRVMAILSEYNETANALSTIRHILQARLGSEEPHSPLRQFCAETLLAVPAPEQPRRLVEWEHFTRNAKRNTQNAARNAQLRRFPDSRQRRFAPRPTAKGASAIGAGAPIEFLPEHFQPSPNNIAAALSTDEIQVVIHDDDLTTLNPEDITDGLI